MPTKYFYQNIPLKEYCSKKNLNYNKIIQIIKEISNSKDFQKYNLNQITKIAVQIYKKTNTTTKKKYEVKYHYQNKPLKDYCIENGFSYSKIVDRIKRFTNNELHKDKTLEEIIHLALNPNLIQKPISNKNKYTYNGETLTKFCTKNELKYGKIINYLNILNKIYTTLSNQEIVNFLVEYFLYQKEKENNDVIIRHQLSTLKKLLENKLNNLDTLNNIDINEDKSILKENEYKK